MVALFGPSSSVIWRPWHDSPGADIHTVVQRDWKCVPCGRDGCQGSKKSRCLEDIRPEKVQDLLAARLRMSLIRRKT